MVYKRHVLPAALTAIYVACMAVAISSHDVKPVLAATCGNNSVEIGEACDGSDLQGFSCAYYGGTGSLGCNFSCTDFDYSGCVFPYCGDGSVNNGGEQCDDGNNNNGDGCSSSCSIETPPPACGDGSITTGENCDDGNASNGDGCNGSCFVESGYSCSGSPSSCAAVCGDGQMHGSEACDDGNLNSYDGCDASCTSVESGYSCIGTGPGSCAPICGDGIPVGSEACDDGNLVGNDGCDSSCNPESGWSCGGTPSSCTTTCGDGIWIGDEECDDGNNSDGDGCDNACATETGWACNAATYTTSICTRYCGNGSVEEGYGEECDDGNEGDGDGCSAACEIEIEFCGAGKEFVVMATGNEDLRPGAGEIMVLNGTPTYYSAVAEDGEDLEGAFGRMMLENTYIIAQTNDDSGTSIGKIQVPQFNNEGSPYYGPSMLTLEVRGVFDDGEAITLRFAREGDACLTTCGNGSVEGTEICDDDNVSDGDGCSRYCEVEAGWECDASEPSVCGEASSSSSSVSSSSSSISSSSSSAESSAFSDPAAGQGGGGGRGSFDPPVASGRKANGVKSEEVEVTPIPNVPSPTTPNRSVQQWYTPALRMLQQSRWNADREAGSHPTALVAAAPLSRREIDELLAAIHWAACEEGAGSAADRKAKRLAALSPDEQRKRIALDLRINKIATRGAVMKRIAELLCLPMGSGDTPFKDLDPASPYAPAIAALTRKELITGYLDESGRRLDRIGAEEPITTAEIAVLLGRLRIPLD